MTLLLLCICSGTGPTKGQQESHKEHAQSWMHQLFLLSLYCTGKDSPKPDMHPLIKCTPSPADSTSILSLEPLPSSLQHSWPLLSSGSRHSTRGLLSQAPNCCSRCQSGPTSVHPDSDTKTSFLNCRFHCVSFCPNILQPSRNFRTKFKLLSWAMQV